MVNVDLYSAIITKVSNALDTLVSGEKPGFQTLSEGLVVHDNVAYVIYTIDINTPEIRQSVLLRNIHLLYGINTKKLQFIHSVNGNGAKPAKITKKVILPTITLPKC